MFQVVAYPDHGSKHEAPFRLVAEEEAEEEEKEEDSREHGRLRNSRRGVERGEGTKFGRWVDDTWPHRGCLTGTVRSRRFRKDRRAGHASAVFDRCYTGITLLSPLLLPPFYSFPLRGAPLYFFRLRSPPMLYPILRSTRSTGGFCFGKNCCNCLFSIVASFRFRIWFLLDPIIIRKDVYDFSIFSL